MSMMAAVPSGFGRCADQSFPPVQKLLGFLFMQLELRPQRFGVALLKTVDGTLLLLGQSNLPAGHRLRPSNVVDAVGCRQERPDSFESVSDLDGDGIEVDAATLLKIG